MNPDGTALVQVTTPEQGFAIQATWTPDGSHLVVAAFGADDELRLYSVAADGSDWHLLVPDGPGFADFGPRVSPGRTIGVLRPLPARSSRRLRDRSSAHGRHPADTR